MTTEITQFDELKSELTSLVAPTLLIKVTDFPTSNSAIESAKAIKGLQKRVEAKRKDLVAPLNERVKAINDYAKSIASPLDDAETHLKKQLAAFEVAQEKIRAEEYRIAEEARLKREAELLAKQEAEREQLAVIIEDSSIVDDVFGSDPTEAPIVDQAAQLEQRQLEERARVAQQARDREWEIKQQGIKNARKTWKCEAVDLAKVPKEFLIITLNSAAVLAAARGGVTEIPGVKLWQETTISIGATTRAPALSGSRS